MSESDLENSRGKFLSDQDFLKHYYEMESTPIKLVCMESVVPIPALPPKSCQSVHLHYVAIKEATHAIEGIRLYDKISGNVVEFERVVEFYVHR